MLPFLAFVNGTSMKTEVQKSQHVDIILCKCPVVGFLALLGILLLTSVIFFFLILRTAHIVFHNVSVVLIGFLIGTICTLDVDKRLLVNVSINLGYSVDYV